MENNQAIAINQVYVLGVRERVIINIVGKNPGIMTSDMRQAMLKYGVKKQKAEYDIELKLKDPYLALQDKGMIYGKSKGGRSRYWYLTDIGSDIFHEKVHVIEASTDYIKVLEIATKSNNGETLSTGDLESACRKLYHMMLPSLRRQPDRWKVVLGQLPNPVADWLDQQEFA